MKILLLLLSVSASGLATANTSEARIKETIT
jgi:hypothetical protein